MIFFVWFNQMQNFISTNVRIVPRKSMKKWEIFLSFSTFTKYNLFELMKKYDLDDEILIFLIKYDINIKNSTWIDLTNKFTPINFVEKCQEFEQGNILRKKNNLILNKDCSNDDILSWNPRNLGMVTKLRDLSQSNIIAYMVHNYKQQNKTLSKIETLKLSSMLKLSEEIDKFDIDAHLSDINCQLRIKIAEMLSKN